MSVTAAVKKATELVTAAFVIMKISVFTTDLTEGLRNVIYQKYWNMTNQVFNNMILWPSHDGHSFCFKYNMI
ncbi:hypothetical protein SAMN04487860_10794 [Ruminococcus flavefaciens]|uniref:Uncharacterized protein n=1 Tax=Ruminococcus flavefaciens TaxID=1265 RepID=A0A1M7K589_RUMFL|nr:hypothetical protein SAMN04487860_10794 [Ruminococcus flavefaciens]